VQDPAVPSRLALATASLDAAHYRAALVYAEQVLELEPEHAGAIKIRDEARGMIAKFDAAISDARRRLAARDLRGAERALDTARSIDAGAPSVTEVALRIAEASRPRQQAPEPTRGTRAAAEPQRAERPVETPPRSTQRLETPPPPAPKPEAPPPEPVPSTQVPVVGSAPTVVAPRPVPTPPNPPASSSPSASERRERAQEPPSGPSAEEDEAAIRRLVATYARAIESKDVGLFRTIKPNLSFEEERRLQEGFRAVTSQRVNLTVLSIDRRGEAATVILRRRDTLQAGGRQQTAESQQTMTLARTGRNWTIVDIR
jgi:hypothetical protein